MSIFLAYIDKVGDFTSAVGLLCVFVFLLNLNGFVRRLHLQNRVSISLVGQIDFKSKWLN